MRLSRLCDAILALIAIEAVVIARRFPPGERIGPVSNALAGMSLVMAVRSTLTGTRPSTALFWIAASLPAHLADLGARARG